VSAAQRCERHGVKSSEPTGSLDGCAARRDERDAWRCGAGVPAGGRQYREACGGARRSAGGMGLRRESVGRWTTVQGVVRWCPKVSGRYGAAVRECGEVRDSSGGTGSQSTAARTARGGAGASAGGEWDKGLRVGVAGAGSGVGGRAPASRGGCRCREAGAGVGKRARLPGAGRTEKRRVRAGHRTTVAVCAARGA
jgi:hypothetical protein